MMKINFWHGGLIILLVFLSFLSGCERKPSKEEIMLKEIKRQNDWLREQVTEIRKEKDHGHGQYIIGLTVLALLSGPTIIILFLGTVVVSVKPLRQSFIASWRENRSPGQISQTDDREYVKYEDVTPESSSAANGVHVEPEPKDEKAKLWEAAVQAYRRKQKTKDELGEEATDEISRDYIRRLDQENNDTY